MNFASGLYRGTADAYQRFRLGYPPALIEDLLFRARTGGRLLDVACGTGQLALALRPAFAEVWAVDAEPGMIRVLGRAAPDVHTVISRAEDFVAADFDLVTIGNAFHRLHRDEVARRALGWLLPGGHLALCWSSPPWIGEFAWQQTFGAVLSDWQERLGVRDRVPVNWEADRQARPDMSVLADAGFSPVGSYTFSSEHRWTVPELAGFIYATSFLGAPVIGDRALEFEADLAARLGPGPFVDQVSYAYDLAERSAA